MMGGVWGSIASGILRHTVRALSISDVIGGHLHRWIMNCPQILFDVDLLSGRSFV